MTTLVSAVPAERTLPRASHAARYLQLATIVLAAGAIYPILYLRQVYQTTMLQAFGISNTELGVLYAILGTSFLVTYLPSGWLADRVAPRLLITVSLLGTGSLGLWYASLPGYPALLAIYCGFGLTTGLTFWAATLKQVQLIAGPNEKGRFFGLLDGGRGLVEAVLASLALVVFVYAVDTRGAGDVAGLRDVMLFYAVTCLAVGLLYLAVSSSSTRAVPAVRAGRRDTLGDLKLLMRLPEVWLVAAIIFCGYHVFLATYSFSAYLQEGGFGLSATLAGAIVTVKLWLRPVGGIGGGYLGDWLSKTRVLFWCLVLSAAGLLAMVALPGIGSTSLVVASLLFVGMLTYAIRGLYWAILDDCGLPPEITGLAIGIISLAGYAPDVYLPVLNGIIADRFPGLDGSRIYFGYVAAVCLVGAGATAALRARIHARKVRP